MEELCKVLCLALLLASFASPSQGFRVRFPKPTKHKKSHSNGLADRTKIFFKEQIPENKTEALPGQSLVLDCEAGGRPAPTIHWLFNGNRISQGRHEILEDDEAIFENSPRNHKKPVLRLGSTKSRLFIDCLTEEDQGEYACVAETATQKITTKTRLTLDRTTLPSDYVESCTIKRLNSVGEPARVYMWTAQRLEYIGRDVQLFCRANGNPAPTITWYDNRGNKIKEDNDQYKVVDNGDLLIRKIGFLSNMGEYKCVAENEIGNDTVATFLYPTSP